jgi:50S ribosomal protein L16 3-hydroxylase
MTLPRSRAERRQSTAEFWRKFARRHWEKSPIRIDRPFAQPLASAADVFQALVAAGARSRPDPFQGPLQFFIDNALLYGGARPYLPAESDGSLEGYAGRMAGLLGGRHFAIRLTEYGDFDPGSWFRVREFLRPLFELVGIPAVPTRAVLFLGDYATTPFGIHRDYHGTFVFVVAGHKRFRTWPSKYFRDGEPSGELEYAAHLGRADTFDGLPGDIIYWPSDRWHVGEAVEGFSATLSIAVWGDVGLPVKVDAAADPGHRNRASRSRSGPSGPVVRPSNVQQPARLVRRIAASALRSLRRDSEGAAPRDAAAADWLRRATALGLESPPPPLPWRTLTDDDRLTGDPIYPVVWLPADEDRAICAANGHSFEIPAHRGILRMFEALNEGCPHRVRDLLTKFSGTFQARGIEIAATREGVRDVLEKLVTLRAVSVG